MHTDAAALTDTGLVRSHNEDAFGVCIEAGFFVVCDGMGGAAGGEVASQTAVAVVAESICSGHLREDVQDDPHPALVEAIHLANRRVFSHAERDPALHGMGTTLVSLLVREGRVWTVHVGDSRCYRFRGGELTRLTEDHSFVDEQIRLGQMTPAEAAVSPFRNIITRAIGTREAVEPEIHEFAAETGDLYLLCSDGLTKEVSDARLGEMLGENVGEKVDDLCARLVEEAKSAGGRDNVTVVVVRIS